MMVKSAGSPAEGPNWRSRRCPTEWKVPPCTRAPADPTSRPARAGGRGEARRPWRLIYERTRKSAEPPSLLTLGGEGGRCYPLEIARVQGSGLEREYLCETVHDTRPRQSRQVAR